MAEIDKKTDTERIREVFEPHIARLKESEKFAEEQSKNLGSNEEVRTGYMNAEWSWNFASAMYQELWRLWGITGALMEALVKENKSPEIEAQVKALAKEMKKHKPALLEFERIMKESKAELRRYK